MKEIARHDKDTGSSEVQISGLTEKIENLSGLEIDLVYEWELGSMLIFDRTRLHCSSSLIDGKKIGLTTFTKK